MEKFKEEVEELVEEDSGALDKLGLTKGSAIRKLGKFLHYIK